MLGKRHMHQKSEVQAKRRWTDREQLWRSKQGAMSSQAEGRCTKQLVNGLDATSNSIVATSMWAKEVGVGMLAEWGRRWVALLWGRGVVRGLVNKKK